MRGRGSGLRLLCVQYHAVAEARIATELVLLGEVSG